MLLFRIICAIFVAWAVNWTMGRPEADGLNELFPEFGLIAPFAGAFVGYFNLAPRQGWGGIVAVANGVWTGILCLGLTGFLFVGFKALATPQAGSFNTELVLRVISDEAADLMEGLASFPLIVLVLAATSVVGVVTELIHWALVQIRRARGVRERNTKRMHRPSMYG